MSWGIGDRVGVAVSAGTIATFNSRRPGPVPSLVLDFAGTGTLDSRVTFTRSTTGTYYNSSGVLTTAAINAARFDYNPSTLAPLGLLIEQSSTNLLTYSADFSNVAWVKVFATIASSSVVAPDGTNFQKLVESATLTSHAIYRPVTVTSGTSYTNSAYVKAAERTFCTVGITDTGVDYTAIVNLSTGTIVSTTAGSTSTITNVGNGIYRVSLTRTVTATSVNPFIGIYNGSTTYNGDGTSGIYIWGAQLEALAFATSYIPTTTAQVTRAVDSASMIGTNFSSWFNQTEGTIYADYSTINTGTPRVWTISDNTVSNQAWVQTNPSPSIVFNVYTSGAYVAQIGLAASTSKAAATLKANDFAVSNAGGTVFTDTLGAIATYTKLSIGARFDDVNGSQIGGYIKKFSYYPTRLTNAQLQAITT
jgi:hypothetical protein